MPPRGGGGRGGGGRGGGGRGGGGRGGGGRGGGGRGGGGSRSGGGGGSIKSSNSGKKGPSNKQATTTSTTTTRWPNLFWPFLNFKFTPSPTKRVITTPAPVRETTPAPEFPPTPDFQPTTDENWIANLFRNMKNTTTETPAMTSMTTTMSVITNPYRRNGISSIGNSFKNESTDIFSLQKDSQYSIFNTTAVIAAISVIATLILVSIIIAIYLWRRQKAAKSDSKENLFPYQAEAAYSTPDKQLQTISGLVGACYAKENDYCRLENDANKKFEKENNYKQKIVWSISKQSEKDVDPPYADYSIVFSGKV